MDDARCFFFKFGRLETPKTINYKLVILFYFIISCIFCVVNKSFKKNTTHMEQDSFKGFSIFMYCSFKLIEPVALLKSAQTHTGTNKISNN